MDKPTLTEPRVEPAPASALDELTRDPSSRARFLKMVGGAGAAGAFATLIAACGGGEKQPQGGGQGPQTQAMQGSASQFGEGDIGILNYALTLEYLEADFYDKAAQSGMLKGAVLEVAKSLGQNEQEHVEGLKGTVEQMGGKPVAQPKATFPLESQQKILETAAEVENLGAAAYLGQAGLIQNKEVLAAALSIHSVEARHAAALNSVVGKSIVPDGAFAKPADMETVLAAVKPFLQS